MLIRKRRRRTGERSIRMKRDHSVNKTEPEQNKVNRAVFEIVKASLWGTGTAMKEADDSLW